LNTITTTVDLTVYITTAVPVVDLIAVTDIQALLGAVPPDRVLDKPRKWVGEVPVEGPGVDPVGHSPDDVAQRPGW
jgi:hypothetical protein